MKKNVVIDKKDFTILINEGRKELNHFPTKPEMYCDICDPLGKEYHPSVIFKNHGGFKSRICKTCLHNMIEAMSNATIENIKGE